MQTVKKVTRKINSEGFAVKLELNLILNLNIKWTDRKLKLHCSNKARRILSGRIAWTYRRKKVFSPTRLFKIIMVWCLFVDVAVARPGSF